MLEKRCFLLNENEKINYLVFLPNNIEDNLPVLLFLHGIGERGNNIDDIKRYSLPAYLENMELPYIVICPQCLENNFWDYHLRDVEKILEVVINKYKCDRSRVCIMGSSMGACGAWNYIMQRPNLFKCLISASGRATLPIDENIDKIVDKSFLIYHGDKDDVIDVKNSIEIYNLLKEKNSDVELKIIKDGNHYVCSSTYKDPYVYKWLVKKL